MMKETQLINRDGPLLGPVQGSCGDELSISTPAVDTSDQTGIVHHQNTLRRISSNITMSFETSGAPINFFPPPCRRLPPASPSSQLFQFSNRKRNTRAKETKNKSPNEEEQRAKEGSPPASSTVPDPCSFHSTFSKLMRKEVFRTKRNRNHGMIDSKHSPFGVGSVGEAPSSRRRKKSFRRRK